MCRSLAFENELMLNVGGEWIRNFKSLSYQEADSVKSKKKPDSPAWLINLQLLTDFITQKIMKQ
jgi:hypothetical protein